MRVRTLGGLALEGSELTRPQPLLLLAYVALEGPKGRRELADLFFMHTADPRDSLSTSLRYLRKDGRGCVSLVDDTVACAVPCDAVSMLERLAEGDVDSARREYRGEFLAGLDLSLGEEIEAWVFETREWLARKLQTELLDRAAESLNHGSMDTARTLAEEALHLAGAPDPSPETLTRLLPILERVGSSEVAVVRKWFQEWDLEDLASRASADAHQTTRIPAFRTGFVGRRSELAKLTDLLVDGDARLVTILGFGGIGKTRLAAELATRLTARAEGAFPGGVSFISVEQSTSQRDVLAQIGMAVNVRPPRCFDIDLLAQDLQGAPRLLVLDNFEHLDPVEAGISALLDACPDVKLLVTSRRRLELRGEHVHPLEGLEQEHRNDADESDAVALFFERAREAMHRNSFDADATSSIERICKRLGGYPLGIELAASMSRWLQPVDIEQVLEESFGNLGEAPTDAPDRHRTMRAAFDSSWAQLAAAERDALVCLSTLPGPFDHQAACHIATIQVTMLLRLADRSMLSSDGRLFRFHPVLHVLIRNRAAQNPAHVNAARERLVEWADGLLASSVHAIQDAPRGTLAKLEANLPNLLEAVRLASANDEPRRGVSLMRALVVDCNYLSARGTTEGLLGLLEGTVDLAEADGDFESAHHLATKLGNARRELHGEMELAKTAYERALELAERAGLPGRKAILLGILGTLSHILGDGDPMRRLSEGRDLAQELGDDVALSHVLQNWSYVAGQGDDVDLVLSICQEAVDVALRLKRSRSPVPIEVDQKLFYSLFNLGEAFRLKGSTDESLDCRRQALGIARERDQILWAAYALEEIGTTHHEREEPDLAREALDESLALYRAAGADYHVANVLELMRELGFVLQEETDARPAQGRVV